MVEGRGLNSFGSEVSLLGERVAGVVAMHVPGLCYRTMDPQSRGWMPEVVDGTPVVDGSP